MPRLVPLVLCLSLALNSMTGSAQTGPIASPREDAAWSRVEQLYPGQPIALLQPGSARRYQCDLDRVDDAILTCTRLGVYGPPQRVVFARGQISRVWTIQQVAGPSGRALAIAAAIGATLGGISFAPAGVGGVFIGITLGAGIAIGFVEHSFVGETTRQVLVYKSHAPHR